MIGTGLGRARLSSSPRYGSYGLRSTKSQAMMPCRDGGGDVEVVTLQSVAHRNGGVEPGWQDQQVNQS